ncbi:LCP family protein [Patescibacteria group bacterium]|nr:LCP family protein [Patescibacteria group bacterium]
MPWKRFKRKIFSRPRLIRSIGIGIICFAFLAFIFYLLSPYLSPVVKTGQKIILPQNNFTLKNDNGRTNILVLGVGGGTHDGPNLTDTMIVVSAVTKLPKDNTPVPPITLISIPRDIYLDSLPGKINSAYDLGGLTQAETAVATVTGLPIHYAVRIDFSVFEKIIDTIGGIDVNVTNTLDDYQYPIDGKENDTCGFSEAEVASRAATIIDDQTAFAAFPCRYEHLHFDPGLQHMDGTTALKFVRSRHAQWPEGSDFARSQRQQLVIKAIRDKVFTLPSLLNVGQDLAIYNQLKSHIDTDFDFSSPQDLLNLALKYRSASLRSITLDENVLVNPPQDQRGWILIPKNGSWDEIHQLIATESGQAQ